MPSQNAVQQAQIVPEDNNHHILNSWKEIAAYLGKSVRTVQRMEVELGLPVRRPKGHARSSVMAFSTELDQWLKSFSPRRPDGFSASVIKATDRAQIRPARVLVVDAHEMSLCAVTKTLRTYGYEVATAQTGRDALELAVSFAEVILLDVNLPEIHGLEVLRRLRTGLSTSHIPVICTSATYSPEGAAPVALQLGAKRFLTHPIPPEELHSAIQEVLPTSAVAESA
ncbi:MAG TPA: response regulator [Terriglobales bacterium]|nr:response regulator [Terriglobales bacterium]